MIGRGLLAAGALLLGASAGVSQKLPPANPLPPPASEEAAVLATVDAVFAALEAGDGPALLKHVQPDGRISAVGARRDGTSGIRQQSFAEYAGRMKPGQGFVERITNPAIEIDDDVAMLWAPFTVVVDGKLGNCGVDHFDFIREGGVWKVANLTFSSRTAGCLAPPR